MGRVHSIFETITGRVRPMEVIQTYGFTILFYACALLVAHLSLADFRLQDFDGRTISQATLADISIASRTGLYTSSIAVFLGATAVGILAFRVIGRWMSPATRALLETSSIGGLIFLYLAAYKAFAVESLQLVVGFQALVVLGPLVERWTLRRELDLDRTAYFAWIVTTALCLCFPLFGWLSTEHAEVAGKLSILVVGFAFALHLLVCVIARASTPGAGSSRVERFMWASMPLCLLPASAVLHVELYALLNNAGYAHAPGPKTILAFMCAGLCAWAVARWLRDAARQAPADPRRIERMLGRRSFPLALAGIVSFILYRAFLGPWPWADFMEPGNPGLAIQQWFDFGRWPFFETFDAHCLSDSLFGLVYAWITGFRDETWQFYDHADEVLGALAVYFVLARVTGSIYLAIFSVMFLPYIEPLFPHHFVLALATVFVLRWVLVRDDLRAWFVFFLYLIFCVLWRIDLGVATGAASIFTLFACRWVAAQERWSLSKAARGAVLAAMLSLSIALVLALVKGVAIVPLARDLLNILGSNQGFGLARLAYERNDVFIWHHFLIPVLVFVVAYLMYVRWRGRLRPREDAAYVFIALAFMTGYYFANFPRGLVRHSFLEPGNVYTSSFAFAILGLAVYGLARISPRASYVCFVLVSSTLAYNFSLDDPVRKTAKERDSLYERLARRSRYPATIVPSSEVIDRSPIRPEFREKHIGSILPFLQENLEPDQTFLDLSNSPMLYFYAHRRSPHYLNHLLVVHNDYLQERVLEELQHHDVPLVLLTTEPSLCAADGATHVGAMDGVPFRLRHYRLHEYVYEHYQPLCIVQRWHVWARRDWSMPALPHGEDRQVQWSLAGSPSPSTAQDARETPGTLEVRNLRAPADQVLELPQVHLEPDHAFYLRVSGTSPRGGKLRLKWRTSDEHDTRVEEREIDWPAGRQERHVALPPLLSARWLELLSLDGAGVTGLELDAFDLVRMQSNRYTSIAPAVLAPVTDQLRFLPYVWGRFDQPRTPRVTVRTLLANTPTDLPEKRKQTELAQSTSAPRTDVVLEAGSVRQFSFDPLPAWDPACYIVLRARVSSADTTAVFVDYGEDELNRGRFSFQPRADGEEHEYVIRASVQYDWNVDPKNWISVAPQGGAMELVGLEITRGD